MEDPHTWSKFGATLQAQTQKAEPTIEKSFMPKDPIKKRVFAVGFSFWLSIILAGGSYVLIEGLPNEKTINEVVSKIFIFIENEIVTDDYVDDSGTGFKLVENTNLGFQMEIPTRLEEAGEDMLSLPIYSDTDVNDIRNVVYAVEKIDAEINFDINLHTEWLADSYSDDNFVLIEEVESELNNLPARKYVFEVDTDSGRVRVVEIIHTGEHPIYVLSMSDDANSFPASLNEFEVTRKSFLAW
jgi:hypothetical protein